MLALIRSQAYANRIVASVEALQLLQMANYTPRREQSGLSSDRPGTADFGYREVPREQKVNLVAEVFSSVASSYDVMNDFMSVSMHRLWKDKLVSDLGPFPGMKHLDVAGGTGDVAFRVLRAIRRAEAEEHQRQPSAQQHRQQQPQASRPTASPPQNHLPAQAVQEHNHSLACDGPGPRAGAACPPRQQLQQERHPQQQPGYASPGSVVVCDINPEMLAVGRNKAQTQRDLAEDRGLSFVEGNAEQLPFPDESFDSYTIAFGIRNVTDRDAALREAKRALKRGGRFMCLEFSQVQQPLLRQLYDAYSFAVIPRIGGLVANDANSYQYLVESIRRFPDQETFADMICGAGLSAVGYENILDGVVAMHWGYKL